MATVRRLLVAGLERLCTLLDRIPTREQGRWFIGGWGCRIGLARWSDRLDQRWHTGHWEEA